MQSTSDPGIPSRQNQDSDGIAGFMARAISGGASSQRIAEIAISSLEGIEQALTPIIGSRGVAALYKRSLHLARKTYTWLPVESEGIPSAMDFAELTPALGLQTAADAAAAATLLLQTFYSLLNPLIGPALTERLLRSVWAYFPGEPASQDTTP
jgi:hypothetical protein